MESPDQFYFFLPTGMAFQHTSDYFAGQKTRIREWGELSRKRAEKFFDFLDQHLEQSEFIAGDYYSIADITAQCTVDFARAIKLRPAEQHTHLRRWHASVSQRPSASA